ncbi:hypothetical protein WG66_009509 [Moniliophthora roreri]|nr:hypothetical protein WG66_009509 [Moniliophthora roreri]
MVERDLWGRRWKSQLKDINVTFLVSSWVVSSASGFTLGSESLVYRLGETVSGSLWSSGKSYPFRCEYET